DGQYFYGGNASTEIYKMDFANKTLISTTPTPSQVLVRSIAYDPTADSGQGGFWINNWSSNMYLIERNGTIKDSILNIPLCYGSAYDQFSEGGPYLWISRTSSDITYLEKFDIAAGATTGFSFQAAASASSGGLFIQEGLTSGSVTIGVFNQGTDHLYGYELCMTETWLDLSNDVGNVTAGGSQDITLNFDATNYTEGTIKTASFVFEDNFGNESGTVNVTMTVIAASSLTAPANVVTSISGTDLVIDWDDTTGATGYDVYSSDDPYGTFTKVTSVGTNKYIIAASLAKKFYYIVATDAKKSTKKSIMKIQQNNEVK
ncbi:MAG: hypothetical protein KAH33_02545, partial [Candidatus Delongbacteria bacterium]|nr:hypothetical protein [Candidatus Delongbacteria bacterium]